MRLRFALLALLIVCVPAASAAEPIDDYAYDHAKKCRKHPGLNTG